MNPRAIQKQKRKRETRTEWESVKITELEKVNYRCEFILYVCV